MRGGGMYKNINKIRALLICATIGCGVVLCIYYSIRFMQDDIYISVWETDSSSLRKIFPFDFEPISSYWVLKQITPGGILPGPSTIQKWGIVNITEQSADELRKKYIWKPYHGNRPLAEIPDFDVKKNWFISDDIINRARLNSGGGIILLHENTIYFFWQYN